VIYNFTLTLQSRAEKFRAKGTCDVVGIAHFGDTTEKVFTRKDGSQFKLSAVLTETEDSAFLTVTSTDLAPPQATRTIVAELAAYSRERGAPSELKVPVELFGAYTVAAPALDSTTQGRSVETYPSGTGAGTLSIGNGGVVRCVARLADGTSLASSGLVTHSDEIILYSPLYGGAGLFAARLKTRDTAGVSDIDATEVIWVRPAKPGLVYPDGWPAGISAGFIGCKYQRPPTQPPTCALPGIGPEDADGNARLTLKRGNLEAASAVPRALNLSTKNRVTILGNNTDRIALRLSAKTGLLTGTLRHPVTGKRTKVFGAALQKQSRALGFFPGLTEGGALEFEPAP
jgi:hypothetical protein